MGDDSFWTLCWNGDIEGVQTAIENGADIINGEHWPLFYDYTGLMAALENNQNNVVQLLLNHPQIDVDARGDHHVNKVDPDQNCVLHYAVEKDNHEGMAVLLARQDLTTINQKNEDGETPIMKAVYQKAVTCFKLLLNHLQIDVNIVNPNGLCVLHYAVDRDNHEGIAALLARQDLTTINKRDAYGETPIMQAIKQHRVNCFNLLLAHPEVDLDTRDNYRRSPEEIRR